jgi:hypothetical protein
MATLLTRDEQAMRLLDDASRDEQKKNLEDEIKNRVRKRFLLLFYF